MVFIHIQLILYDKRAFYLAVPPKPYAILSYTELYLVGKSQFGKNPRTNKLFRKELLPDGLTVRLPESSR